MKRLFIVILVTALFGIETSFSQEVYQLSVIQPPLLSLTVSGPLSVDEGVEINLDTLFLVVGEISYVREWKFNDGVQIQSIDNPILTLTENGVFHLTIIDENGCTTIDSISLNVITGLEDLQSDQENLLNIQVYPNPNTGTFDILIPDCLPGYSIQILNSVGVQILNRNLECNTRDYNETIILPRKEPGMYYLLVKKNKKILYKQKVIILN